MKRVLVTGAGGFIGRRAIGPLLERGFEVHVADVLPPILAAHPPDVTWHQVDLLAAGSARAVVDAVRPSHLLHLAWYAAHGRFWASPENLRWVSASLDLVTAFREAGGERAAFAGTCVEYETAHGFCSERLTPLVPHTLYGAAKDALRRTIEAYAQVASLSWAWGRVFSPFGPGEHPERLVPAAAGAIIRGERTRCSHGLQVRDFMHVEDVGRAFVELLDTGVEGPVNIASGAPHTIRELVSTLAALAGRPELAGFGDLQPSPTDPPFLVADVRRLRDEVGFVPRFGFADGLRSALEAARESTTPQTQRGPA